MQKKRKKRGEGRRIEREHGREGEREGGVIEKQEMERHRRERMIGCSSDGQRGEATTP